jgi:hypothetical protein
VNLLALHLIFLKNLFKPALFQGAHREIFPLFLPFSRFFSINLMKLKRFCMASRATFLHSGFKFLVDRTSKPNLSPEPQNLEADPLIEEALKAPLPTGPAPKKPPRTFVHDAFIQQQQQETPKEVGDSNSCSPTRPVRRNKALQQQQQQQANPAKRRNLHDRRASPWDRLSR